MTVRDFTTVYDTYVQSEIHLMELQLEQVDVVKGVKCRTKTKMTKMTTFMTLEVNHWTKMAICEISKIFADRMSSRCARRDFSI